MNTTTPPQRPARRHVAWLTPLLALAVGCDQATYASGVSDAFQVRDATFVLGALPEDATAEGPSVVYAASVGYVVTQGQGNIQYNGLVSKDSYALLVAAQGVSEGYWIVTLDGPDVTQNNDLLFDFTADFTREMPYGLQTLSFVVTDEAGAPGPRYDSTLCVLPDVSSNNLAACDPEVEPQSAVVSLRWDTNVDLDLRVLTPEGKLVSWKAPTTALAEGTISKEDLADPTTGELSRDSNGNCDIDGIRLESLIFPGDPPSGEYKLYASLHATCGQPTVHYEASVYRRVAAEDGTFLVEGEDLASGVLSPVHADGGASLGTFITSVTLP
jgi:hypothetical protein